MPGVHSKSTWPDWPEYTKHDIKDVEDTDYIETKRAIIEEFGEEALRQAWLKTCEQLQDVTDRIALLGHEIIPSFDADQILQNGFSPEQSKEFKDIGCCVIQGVLPEERTTNLYQELRNYVKDNQSLVKGWPEASPSMLILYDSPTQIKIRTHPRHLQLQRALNQIWSGYSEGLSPEPLLYTDGIRDRPPGQVFLGLGPHIDAGSLARWADPAYRSVYHQIFSGHIEKHDCFDINARSTADQYHFPGVAHSTVLRTFQGWTALTETAGGEGSIKLYPNVRLVISYVLLRPFFKPPPNTEDIMDAGKWAFDRESSWFPGTFKPQSQYLSPTSHPHLRLKECLIDIPRVKPGDTVWWHADVRFISIE